MVEGARLESVCTGNRTVSSNLIPSAILLRAARFAGLQKPQTGTFAQYSHALLANERAIATVTLHTAKTTLSYRLLRVDDGTRIQ